VALFVKAATQRKAEGLVVLDMRAVSSVADFFLICSGRSTRQVAAIAEHIQRFLKERGVHAQGVEGMGEGKWVLLDYGNVVVHVFYESVRGFYDLEGLWADAVRVGWKEDEGG